MLVAGVIRDGHDIREGSYSVDTALEEFNMLWRVSIQMFRMIGTC